MFSLIRYFSSSRSSIIYKYLNLLNTFFKNQKKSLIFRENFCTLTNDGKWLLAGQIATAVVPVVVVVGGGGGVRCSHGR